MPRASRRTEHGPPPSASVPTEPSGFTLEPGSPHLPRTPGAKPADVYSQALQKDPERQGWAAICVNAHVLPDAVISTIPLQPGPMWSSLGAVPESSHCTQQHRSSIQIIEVLYMHFLNVVIEMLGPRQWFLKSPFLFHVSPSQSSISLLNFPEEVFPSPRHAKRPCDNDGALPGDQAEETPVVVG